MCLSSIVPKEDLPLEVYTFIIRGGIRNVCFGIYKYIQELDLSKSPVCKIAMQSCCFSKKEDNFRYISPVIVSIFTIQMKPYL